DEQIAVPVHTKTAGPAVAIIRSCPTKTLELTVTVEDLDAGSEINDIETVLGIDGGSTRANQVAGLGATLAPHELWSAMRTITTAPEQQAEGKEPEKAPVPGSESTLGQMSHHLVASLRRAWR